MRAVAIYSEHRQAFNALAAISLAGLLIAAAQDRTERVVVLFPPEGLIEALPEGARATAAAPTELTVEGAKGLTAALRAAGARIVLSAENAGCERPELP